MIENSYLIIITANRFLGFVRYIQYKPTMKNANRVRNENHSPIMTCSVCSMKMLYTIQKIINNFGIFETYKIFNSI